MKSPSSTPGIIHFGDRIGASKFGHKMTRELYAVPSRKPKERSRREQVGEELWADIAWSYRDDEHAEHSDAYLLVQRDVALRNFDLSMAHFASLEAEEFETALQKVLDAEPGLKPVESLRDWEGVSGVYVMVMDEYKQFYVGQAGDIRKRVRTHWTGRKAFDRLLFGSKYSSVFPADEMRALDTTRLYAVSDSGRSRFDIEQRVEAAADQRFCLNRIAGGEASGLTMMLAMPRLKGRTLGVTAVPMTRDEYSLAWDGIRDMISGADGGDRATLVPRLAAMDMQIYAVTREDGSTLFWSRRDSISGAVPGGRLTAEEFTAFLEALGETVVWPEG